MAEPKRKRRPGGGRKPKGVIRGKKAWFTTRITPETREALERQAALSERSVSQVAEQLLISGLEARRWRDKHRALRSLCFIVERIALEAAGARWLDPTDPMFSKSPSHAKSGEALFDGWRRDPFRYRAFKSAVVSLLTALEPRGEMRRPYASEDIDRIPDDNPAIKELMKRTYESPENFGAYILSNIWRELTRDYPISEEERRRMGYGHGPVGQSMFAEFYQMADARRDLGINEGEKS